MKKGVLLRMEKLEVTNEMMDIAKNDKPVCKNRYGVLRFTYRYGKYLMACVRDGVLKVSIFCTEHMRFGGKEPIYDIFIEKAKEDFITYDHLREKWTTAKLDRLDWPEGAQGDGIYANEESKACILQYLQSEKESCSLSYSQFTSEDDPYLVILGYQEYLRKKHLFDRDVAIMEPWKKRMEQVPGLPKDWNRWLLKVGITHNYIFYEYKRGGSKEGYCTWCEKIVPIHKAKHNQFGKCSCCGHEVQYKAVGRMEKTIESKDTAYLIQRCKEGFVVREFWVRQYFSKSSYQKPVVQSWEQRRFLYNENMTETEFYYGSYKGRLDGWIEGALKKIDCYGYAYYVPITRGKVYGKTIPSLSYKELKYTGFEKMRKTLKYISPVEYLAYWKRYPYVERLAKAGLTNIVKELLDGNESIYMKKGKDLAKQLGIDRFRLGRLREQKGGLNYLEWLRYEKAVDKVIPDNVISWFDKENILPQDVHYILDRMSEVQVKNYLMRQKRESGESIKALIVTWKDYLDMAARVHMDVQDAIVYKVRDLNRRHRELVKRIEDMGMSLKAEEIAEVFPNVNQNCSSLEKYEFEDQEYRIKAPTGIEEILIDAANLHHCVDKKDTYFERINTKETYILMLRRKAEEDKSYYTLEIEPDGTIRQARTSYNRKEKDFELLKPFLYKWQLQLRKKLDKQDYELAERSRKMRKIELVELREKEVKINVGGYRGQLLADVLENDLMENEIIEEIAA